MTDRLIRRSDGRLEWACEHGVGHTVFNPHDWGKWTFSHGCDGCCGCKEYEELKEKYGKTNS